MVSKSPKLDSQEASPERVTFTDADEQFLRFYLEPDTAALLPVTQLLEILKLSAEQIVPIPHMPSWVMGVYNWRGEILWMVDLAELVGLTAGDRYQTSNVLTYTAVVLQANLCDRLPAPTAETQTIGLVIERIDDIEWCNPDTIQPPPFTAVSTPFAPFVRGYKLSGDSEMTAILSVKAIAAAVSCQLTVVS
ncbi:chemotaxis protein CheW [Chroococcidiopsis sp.]|uniref:chemotaxis protein CheW n=1 Tax=Chroococcidiopsis sp. TaxID=3088168 RepID=UPI003F2CC7E8